MENELIELTVKDDQQLVSARDLLKEYNVHPVLERTDLLEG